MTVNYLLFTNLLTYFVLLSYYTNINSKLNVFLKLLCWSKVAHRRNVVYYNSSEALNVFIEELLFLTYVCYLYCALRMLNASFCNV